MTPAQKRLLQMCFERDVRELEASLKFTKWALSEEAQRVPKKGETVVLPNGFKIIFR